MIDPANDIQVAKTASAIRAFLRYPAAVVKSMRQMISINPVGHCKRVVWRVVKPNPLIIKPANYSIITIRI
jgi:hypothetical protein